MPSDIESVDEYLAKWDEFAQGANELVPYLNAHQAPFESALAALLEGGDRRAKDKRVVLRKKR